MGIEQGNKPDIKGKGWMIRIRIEVEPLVIAIVGKIGWKINLDWRNKKVRILEVGNGKV